MAAMPPKTKAFKLDLVILLNILTADISKFPPPTWLARGSCILSSVCASVDCQKAQHHMLHAVTTHAFLCKRAVEKNQDNIA